LLHAESAVVESKASVKEVTRNTFQPAMFWLNAEAELKVAYMLATDATFQPPIGWLNLVASRNMPAIEVTDAVLQPPIIERPVIWDAERERLAMLYFERHKGWPPGQDPKVALRMEPRVIVQHWTAGPTARSAYNTFRAPAQVRRRDRSESNALNLCSHFVVDRDGTIYRLMPEDRMGRHTIGLNHLAIGVENVGDGKRWPLTPAQVEANAALVRWLAAAYPLTHLIAHAEYRWLEGHPYFVETDPGFRTGRVDPGPAFMAALRAAVADLGLQAPTRPARPPRLSARPSPNG
jgi:hypothetical protein